VTTSLRRAALPVLAAALAGLLAGCGGGFSSAPATPPDETVHSYVALGDAFTAAPDADAAQGEGGCARSKDNYPALLAHALEVKDAEDVSCIDATTASLTTESKPGKDSSPVPAQLEAVESDTDLVTVGVGLGDRDLLPHSFQICTALPCGDKVPPQTILDDVHAMAASLTSAVRAIQTRAPEAYIVLVGYPKITPDAGSCDALPELDQPGLDAANQLLDEINREIRSAARDTGAGFLDVARISVGHELCSGDPWIAKPEGKKGATDYLPRPAEQSAVADALATLVRNH
jgi:hypothetical protein